MYSERVLDHFNSPRNVGEASGANAVVEVSNPVCGDIMQISSRVEQGRFAEVRFRTKGCVTAIACGSYLAEWLEGKTIEEARQITPQQISDALGGLPPATVHGSQLVCDALSALMTKIR